MKALTVKALNMALTILMGMGISLVSLSMSQSAEKPKTGGTFVNVLHADPAGLNPVISSEFTTKMVGGALFSKLVYQDLEGNYVGDLAEKWAVSDDGLKIRFDLRKGAKFHDGRPVTAEDVKFSLESLGKYHPRGIELRSISEISILSENSLEVKFPSPSVNFFPYLDGEGDIIPKHIYSTSKDLTLHPANLNPVGSGPYIFQEWKKGSHITLIKNKDFYIPGEPFVDKAVFKIIPSAASRVLALETGDADYVCQRGLPDSDVPRLRANPKFTVKHEGMGTTSFNMLIFNIRRKPWDDVRVRRAVAHAIDRNVLVEKGAFGLANPAYSPFTKGSFPWAYNPEVEKMYPFDLAKAEKLLDEAGYTKRSGGVRFTSPIIFDRGDARTTGMAEILRQQLKGVGIEIVLQPLDKATMAQRIWINFDFDLWTGPSSQGNDPAIGVERLFVTEGIQPVPSVHNANGYSKPEVDKLFLLARRILDQKKRAQYYREVQLILLRDLPIVPLTDTPKFAAFPKKVRGVNERRFWACYSSCQDAWFSE